jgi:hypothetical protein
VELAKGGDISSFLSATTSIIQKKMQPPSRLSPISAVFFRGGSETSGFALFLPKRTVF